MTLGPVRVMGAGVELMLCVEEVFLAYRTDTVYACITVYILYVLFIILSQHVTSLSNMMHM